MTATDSPEKNVLALHAVASAVHVAVTTIIDNADGGDDPVSQVTNESELKEYVESYLDGYQVTPESLAAAIQEGTALSEATLKELISQASVIGVSAEEFFEDGEFDIEAGLAAAASFDPEAKPQEPNIREQVFAILTAPVDGEEWFFVTPADTVGTGSNPYALGEFARRRIEYRELPETSNFAGWGWGYDNLRPDGSIKKGQDSQVVYWGGDEETVRRLLRRVEPLGLVVEGGHDGGNFRLVPAANASSAEPYLPPKRDDLFLVDVDSAPTGFRYATSWVEKNRQPKNDVDWLSEDAAAQLFDADSATDIYIVPNSSSDEPAPWMIQLRPRKKAAVTHYHRPSGSVARIVEFAFSSLYTNSDRRGSLVRGKVSDFIWPDDHIKYAPKTRSASAVVLTDGRGLASTIERLDRASSEKVVTLHRDVLEKPRWITYPLFGAWTPLTDPLFGFREVEG